MRNLKTALSLGLALGMIGTASAANIGSPQEVNIKIYELWVTPNADCTELTRVYNNPNASYQNMVNGPTFGHISVPDGTYKCIAWKMSDIVSVKPNFTSSGGNCVIGNTYTKDLFRVGDSSLSPSGNTITATTSTTVEDTMYVYLSTSGNDENIGNRPSEPGKLQNAYVVSGDNNAVMVTDFTNGIEDTGSGCSPETVTFSFRYQ